MSVGRVLITRMAGRYLGFGARYFTKPVVRDRSAGRSGRRMNRMKEFAP